MDKDRLNTDASIAKYTHLYIETGIIDSNWLLD